MDQLRQIKDVRHPSYCKYSSELLLIMRILAAVTAIGSMRQLTTTFNKTQAIENIESLLGDEYASLDEFPYWETINQFLVTVDPEDIQQMIYKLIRRLIRMRCFEQARIKNKYWQIIVDGTQIHSFSQRHCEHCLTRVHNKGTPNEKVEYYHYVLEAKLFISSELVLSIATEFVENAEDNVSKQDCELNAFKRLASRLKEAFKRLPICLTLDGLYACEPVFALCRENNWHYLIRLKEGRLPSVAEEFKALKGLEPTQAFGVTTATGRKEYSFVRDIPYQQSSLNILELIEHSDKGEHIFIYLTDLHVTSKNVVLLIDRGRKRWGIENQGFNCQKNQGYHLTHLYSRDPIGMKNHYLLTQIGHMLVQLAMFGLKELVSVYEGAWHFRECLLQELLWKPLPKDISKLLEQTFYLPSYIP